MTAGPSSLFLRDLLKVHKRENFLAPILNFILFYSYLRLNIKVLPKKILDCAIIRGNTMFRLY
jgi:hypothetical protein